MSPTGIILLVEDNADDAELALRAFAKHKIANSVVHVSDGEEALDYLFAAGRWLNRDRAGDPAVVLLDLKLPKVSGLEVLRRMRGDARTRGTPVVVLTSSNEESDIAASYDHGANSYVRKPVDYAQFMETVRELCVYWLVLNQLPTRGR